MIPSAVFLVVGKNKQSQKWIVGDVAINMARRQLSLFEPSPKRAMANRTVFLGGQDIPVTEAISAVLEFVAEEAQRQQGGRPPDAFVLTHPATWSQARVQLLEEAGHAATARWRGWPAPTSITEPEAAAQRILDINFVPQRARIVVLDLGGGTADVTVVDRDGQTLTVVGRPTGRDGLGGEDFDLRLARWMTEEVGHPGLYDRLASSADPDERERAVEMRRHARAVKEQLTRSTVVPAQLIKSPPELPDNIPVQVSRPQLEALIRGGEGREPGLWEAVELVTEALKTSPHGPSLAGVFLVGGSSRIPLLGNLIRNQVHHAPIEHGDPTTAVADGAARHAWLALQAGQPLSNSKTNRPDGPKPTLGSKVPPPKSPVPNQAPPSPQRRRRGVFLTLLAVLVGVGGLVAYAANQRPTPTPTPSYTCSNGSVVSYPSECSSFPGASTTSPLPVLPRTPDLASIYLVYAGDQYSCHLQFNVQIDGQTQAQYLTGSRLMMSNVSTGLQRYAITGLISCPTLGQCTATGSGSINIVDYQSYYVSWRNYATGRCIVTLQ